MPFATVSLTLSWWQSTLSMETVWFQHPPTLEQAPSVPGEPNHCDVIFAWKHNQWTESECKQNAIEVSDNRVSFTLTWHDDAEKLCGSGFEPNLCHHVRAKSDTICHHSADPQSVVKHFIHGNCLVPTPSFPQTGVECSRGTKPV